MASQVPSHFRSGVRRASAAAAVPAGARHAGFVASLVLGLATAVAAQGQPVGPTARSAGLALREIAEGVATAVNGQPLMRVTAPAGSTYLMMAQLGRANGTGALPLFDLSALLPPALGPAGVQGATVLTALQDPNGDPLGVIGPGGFQDLDLMPAAVAPPGSAASMLAVELQALVFQPNGDIVLSNSQVRAVQSLPLLPLGFNSFVPPADLPGAATIDWDDIEQGDVDGDGDLDLIAVREDGGPSDVRIWLAVDTGYVGPTTLAQALPAGGFATSAELGDLNGDGFLDLVVAFIGNPANNFVQVWFNNRLTGSGAWLGFTPLDNARIAKEPMLGIASPADVELADVDGDGDLDIFLACALDPATGQRNRLIRNLDGPAGSGIPAFTLFQEITSTSLPDLRDDTEDAEFFDFDNDGDLDLVVAAIDGPAAGPNSYGTGQDYVLVNIGGRFFAPGLPTAGPFPLPPGIPAANPIPNTTDESSDVVVFDMDRDGQQDLYFANWLATTQSLFGTTFGAPIQDKLLRLQGGTYTNLSTLLPGNDGSGTDAEVADFDLDGDLDVVVGMGTLRKGSLVPGATFGAFVLVNPGNVTAPWQRQAVAAAMGVDVRDLEPGDWQKLTPLSPFNQARWFDKDLGVAGLVNPAMSPASPTLFVLGRD